MAFTVKFNTTKQSDFTNALKKRVDDYFSSNKLNRHGDYRLVLKSVIMLSLYFGGYLLIMSGTLNVYLMWLVAALLGVVAAGIGMGFMHDANHGSYSKSKFVNNLMGASMELLGGSSFTWKVKHNILHHTFTNIENMDEDILSRPLYRFTKGAKHYGIHRFQHIYMFFLYGLMTLVWVVVGDFLQLIRFFKRGFVNRKKSFTAELFKIIISKIIYYSYAIVLPLLFIDVAWWQFLIGYTTTQFVFGFILSVTFQMAHMVEKADFPDPEKEKIDENWFVHQLATTADFAQKSKILTWYMGGLNFQVEHHLFPRVSHVHYPAISKIVKKTANEFGIKYNVYKNMVQALVSHFKMLRLMGNPQLAK